MTTMTTRGQIETFLASGRIAVVGAARDPKEFGHTLFRDLRMFGYPAVAVNPQAEMLAGERCYARVQDAGPGVDAALLLTSPAANEQVVQDCVAAGVRRVWFYGTGDRSQENAAAIAYCQAHGVQVIPGYCPYMFLPQAPFFHKLHGFFARLTGSAPR